MFKCVNLQYLHIAYFTNKTVVFLADGAVEDIDGVLVHTPAQTVGGGTVVAALTAGLCHRQTSLQPSLVLLSRHQLSRKITDHLLVTGQVMLSLQAAEGNVRSQWRAGGEKESVYK